MTGYDTDACSTATHTSETVTVATPRCEGSTSAQPVNQSGGTLNTEPRGGTPNAEPRNENAATNSASGKRPMGPCADSEPAPQRPCRGETSDIRADGRHMMELRARAERAITEVTRAERTASAAERTHQAIETALRAVAPDTEVSSSSPVEQYAMIRRLHAGDCKHWFQWTLYGPSLP